MVKELDSGKLMYSVGNNDECYTPDYGVKPILKYIPDAMSGVLLILLIVSLLNKYQNRIKLLLLILVWVLISLTLNQSIGM